MYIVSVFTFLPTYRFKDSIVLKSGSVVDTKRISYTIDLPSVGILTCLQKPPGFVRIGLSFATIVANDS